MEECKNCGQRTCADLNGWLWNSSSKPMTSAELCHECWQSSRLSVAQLKKLTESVRDRTRFYQMTIGQRRDLGIPDDFDYTVGMLLEAESVSQYTRDVIDRWRAIEDGIALDNQGES